MHAQRTGIGALQLINLVVLMVERSSKWKKEVTFWTARTTEKSKRAIMLLRAAEVLLLTQKPSTDTLLGLTETGESVYFDKRLAIGFDRL